MALLVVVAGASLDEVMLVCAELLPR